ncbi:hypothetical protein ACJ72_01020 [Emergomyces africanus]|uniref:LysM domain-containing protein n=1 Tax=Emergomyces africanus TaxID=1955775 RepID=A0A1B7P6G4_9EURO|nr:hypothetical protein ACJ72_01020 [Emergomyces africanus]
MNLQTALVVLAALGVNVNGLPALEPKALQQPPIDSNESRISLATTTIEVVAADSETQTRKTSKIYRSFGLLPKPNTLKGGTLALENTNDIGILGSLLLLPPRLPRPNKKTPPGRPDWPTQPGRASSCKSWYTTKGGDTCDSITKKFGITKEKFLEWNPALSKSCDKNLGNYAYCVKVSRSKKANSSQRIEARAPPTTTGGGAQFRPVSLVSGLVINETPPPPATTGPPTTTGGGGAQFQPVSIISGKIVTIRAVPPPTATASSSPKPSSVCLHNDVAIEGDTCEILAARNRLTVTSLKALNVWDSPLNKIPLS